MKIYDIIDTKVSEFFKSGATYLENLTKRILPSHFEATGQNGFHTVRTKRVIISDDYTMTDGGSSILRNSQATTTPQFYISDTFANKEDLCVTNYDDPMAIEELMSRLKYKQNQDYINLMLWGKKGKEPIEGSLGTNIRGGLLNYVGSQTLEGEIKSISDLMTFVEDAIIKIEELLPMDTIDFSFLDALGTLRTKKFVLIVPKSTGADKLKIKEGLHVIKLSDYLMDNYNIDLVAVPQGLGINKVVLLPFHEVFGYFHVDTWTRVKMHPSNGGKDIYEYFYKSAGAIFSTGKSIISKKSVATKLTGGIDWRPEEVNVNILNDPLKVKQETETKKEPEGQGSIKNNQNKTK